MLKSVTPTTPISIALFAGSNDNLEIIKLRKSDNLRSNDDINSDSESNSYELYFSWIGGIN